LTTFPESLTVIELDEVDSTNRYLKERLAQLEPHLPVLVIGRTQTAGRGREGRGWFSAPGLGLYVSYAFRLSADRLPWLPLAGGVAVAETLTALGARSLVLKWPNDVLGRGRKVAGVLCESSVLGDQAVAVCGLGLNLNHTPVDFPPELRTRAASLVMLGGEPAAPQRVLKKLTRALGAWLEKLERGECAALVLEADRLAAPLRHAPISFHRRDENGEPVVEGFFSGIAPGGGVILEDETGARSEHFPPEIGLI
jgi:BirA family transcriptional regulator, biotin operon repressor / biotin---[acetyl-CoA-carboxylase] ligase